MIYKTYSVDCRKCKYCDGPDTINDFCYCLLLKDIMRMSSGIYDDYTPKDGVSA